MFFVLFLHLDSPDVIHSIYISELIQRAKIVIDTGCSVQEIQRSRISNALIKSTIDALLFTIGPSQRILPIASN